MADVSISFSNGTPEEIRDAQHALEKANDARISRGKEAFASVSEMLEDYVKTRVIKKWMDQAAQDREEAMGWRSKFKSLPEEKREEIEAILNGSSS